MGCWMDVKAGLRIAEAIKNTNFSTQRKKIEINQLQNKKIINTKETNKKVCCAVLPGLGHP